MPSPFFRGKRGQAFGNPLTKTVARCTFAFMLELLEVARCSFSLDVAPSSAHCWYALRLVRSPAQIAPIVAPVTISGLHLETVVAKRPMA